MPSISKEWFLGLSFFLALFLHFQVYSLGKEIVLHHFGFLYIQETKMGTRKLWWLLGWEAPHKEPNQAWWLRRGHLSILPEKLANSEVTRIASGSCPCMKWALFLFSFLWQGGNRRVLRQLGQKYYCTHNLVVGALV